VRDAVRIALQLLDGLDQLAVFGGELVVEFRNFIGTPGPFRDLALQPLANQGQLHEHTHLGAQDFRLQRLDEKIDRPGRVAFEHDVVRLDARGEKNDGDVPGSLPFPDDGGRIDAVHFRHLHVEKNKTEVLLKQVPQRFLTRGSLDEVLAESFQHRLQGDQVGRLIVHHQDVDLGVGIHAGFVASSTSKDAIRSRGRI
jgi:hypothetical protein